MPVIAYFEFELEIETVEVLELYLSVASPKNRPFEKIDFLRSTSCVVFLKAHIKISY